MIRQSSQVLIENPHETEEEGLIEVLELPALNHDRGLASITQIANSRYGFSTLTRSPTLTSYVELKLPRLMATSTRP